MQLLPVGQSMAVKVIRCVSLLAAGCSAIVMVCTSCATLACDNVVIVSEVATHKYVHEVAATLCTNLLAIGQLEAAVALKLSARRSALPLANGPVEPR
jgi:hypothetical protein